MRVVLDTNIWVSGLLWGGNSGRILLLAESQQFNVAASQLLLEEIEAALLYPKLQPQLRKVNETLESLGRRVRQLVAIYPIRSLSVENLRDPDDAIILATALAAKADAVVTGDRDLLILIEFSGIPILTASEFLARYFSTPQDP